MVENPSEGSAWSGLLGSSEVETESPVVDSAAVEPAAVEPAAVEPAVADSAFFDSGVVVTDNLPMWNSELQEIKIVTLHINKAHSALCLVCAAGPLFCSKFLIIVIWIRLGTKCF